MTPVLRTERLEFLPYRPEHEDAFVALLRNEEVCRWMGQDLVPEADIRALFRAILTDVYPQNRFDVWGLWLQGAYVGHAEVKRTGNVDGHELVTALVPEHWGRGLGGEVVRGLLRHAADHLGVDEAYGMVGADNTASLTMCRRLGFRHVRDVVADDGSVTRLLVVPTRTATTATTGTPAADHPQRTADPVVGAASPAADTVDQVAGAANLSARTADPVAGVASPAADTANPVVGVANLAAGTADHVAGVANLAVRTADPVAGVANMAARRAHSMAGEADSAADEAHPVVGAENLAAGTADTAGTARTVETAGTARTVDTVADAAGAPRSADPV